MIEKELTVQNVAGFHVRVASIVCKTAMKYASEVKLCKGAYEADCKSCLDLLSLMCPQGESLTLKIDGADEAPAFEAIETLFQHKFYEDEFASSAPAGL